MVERVRITRARIASQIRSAWTSAKEALHRIRIEVINQVKKMRQEIANSARETRKALREELEAVRRSIRGVLGNKR